MINAYSANEVSIQIDDLELKGTLIVPENAEAIILFAHGSGSSRFSTRNQFVARELQNAGLGTLLFDLLTEEEERIDLYSTHYRFDVFLLANRLSGATEWVRSYRPTMHLRIGYFGASTGAAAALISASKAPNEVFAVVSRGGRPDLAGITLEHVTVPTLLIVGGNDLTVIELNKQALKSLHGKKELVIVPGATHLFEEPGTLENVAQLARDWFLGELQKKSRTA